MTGDAAQVPPALVWGSMLVASFLSCDCGHDGFIIHGARNGDRAQGKPGGDINVDGLDDIIVETNGGPAYVVFGKTDKTPVMLAELAEGEGIVIDASEEGGDLLVMPGTDVNGDGFDDLLVMADAETHSSEYTSTPEIYVVFGGPDIHSVDLSALAPTDGRLLMAGKSTAVSWMVPFDDLNGDGFGDLAVVEGVCCSVQIDVIYGAADPQEVTEAELRAEIGGFVVEGFSNTEVVAADVDGDGLSDLVFEENPNQLEGSQFDGVHVLLGGPDLHALDFWDEYDPPTFDGFTIYGRSVSGYALAAGGDINSDGIDDLVFAPDYASEGVVIFGKESTADVLVPDDLASGAGFMITVDAPNSYIEPHVAPDLNGDGFADITLVAGAYATDRPDDRVYVIYGKADTDPVIAGEGDGGFTFDARPPHESSGKFGGWAQVDGQGEFDLIVSVHEGRFDPPEHARIFVYFDKTPE